MAEEIEQRLNRATEGKLTPQHRRRLQSRSEDWGSWLAVAAVLLCLLGVFMLVYLFVVERFENNAIKVLIITPICIGYGVIVNRMVKWRDRLLYRRMMSGLEKQGVRPHFCLNCGYDLKGSVSTQCPECGTALAPVGDEGADDLSPRL